MFGNEEKLRVQLQKLTQALQASEARFRSVITGNADGIVIVDESGVVRFANPAAAALFNRTEEQLLGATLGFPIVAGDTTELEIVRFGKAAIAEVRIVDTQWDDRAARLLTMRDITERRRAEKELRKMYRAVLDSPNMVIITDPQGAIEFVNPRFTEVTGYTLVEVEGRNPNFLRSDLVPREVYEEMLAAIRSRSVWRGELVSTKKNGELYWESVALAPVRDLAGDVTNFVAISVDITEKKRTEEELAESEKRYRTLFSSLMFGFCTIQVIFDSDARPVDCRFLEINPAFEAKSGLQNARGKLLRDLAPGAESYWLETYGKVALTGEPVRFIREAKTLNRWFDVNAYRVGKPEDRQVAIIFSDITDRKRDEERIKELNIELAKRAEDLEIVNQELEAFNYTAAHDLRQPLNVICSYCQAMEMLCGSNIQEDCKGYIKETYQGALRMNALIDALLSFSRMGHVDPHRETFDLCTVAKETAATLKLVDPERRVDFRIADEAVANADPNLLRVVLNNLLGNAWKYTGKQPDAVIEFGVKEDGGKPVYFVRDNGAGFDKDDAAKLFVPFQRLHGPEQFKGFGIGLATVERIIRRHGGKIWAEGEPGNGATFYFTLAPYDDPVN